MSEMSAGREGATQPQPSLILFPPLSHAWAATSFLVPGTWHEKAKDKEAELQLRLILSMTRGRDFYVRWFLSGLPPSTTSDDNGKVR